MGDTDYLFDDDGNLIQEISPQSTTTYTYSDANRLIAVTKGVDTWEYAYDAFANRVAKTENGTITRYLIDPIGLGNVVAEYDGSGNLTAHYDHGLDLLSRKDAGGNPAHYTFDAIGNVHQLLSAAGVIANAYAYTPFGTPLTGRQDLPNPFGFVAEHGVGVDADGTHYMRERYYHTGFGQFLSDAPIGFMAGDLNPRRYVWIDPIRWVDPLGLGYFGKRPLKDWPIQVNDPVDDFFNTELPHEHYFFNGGDNTGFGHQGRFPETDLSGHERSSGDYDDEVMREALKNMKDWPYEVNPFNPDTENCQEWAERLRREYERLLDERDQQSSEPSRPVDPNQKTGPAGFGTSGFISCGRLSAYRIDFENEPSTTAPAQQVVITDALNSDLELATFQWTDVGWGDQLIVVPPNTTHFDTNVPVSYLGTNFEVQIEAGLRSASGQAYAIFRSIDPATSLPPPVNIGFLPPEDGTGRGRGHISYTINAKSCLTTGTEIRNVAHISFDYQPVIATNQKDPHDPTQGTDPAKECLNTVDADPPSRAVAVLPASNCSQFLVSWSGEDLGAGIASYDIYVSDNGGPWTLWLAGTADPCARYDGEVGHAYAFYSIARDNVGHIESPPLQADAMITATVRVNIISVLYSGKAELTWASCPGDIYVAWSCPDLLGNVWNVEATVPSQGAATTWTDPDTTSALRFYRIGIE